MSLIVGTAVSVWQATVARRAERLAQSRLEQANTETAKANRIASFLEEMLASANPEEGKGLKYTVRQMLDDFSNELGSQLADQPEVEAAVRSIIGKAYWRLGENKIARGHIKAALDLRRRLLAPDDTRIADNLVDYASLESAGENRAGAERLAREALAIYQKQNAGPRPVLAAMWNVHRFTWLQYKRPNRFADADVVAKEALAVAGDLDTTPYPEAANIVRSISQAKLEEKNSARRKTGHARPWPFTAVSTATVIRRRAWVTSA
jgi:tetratricopeptide (TPR) repeat protein